MSGEGTQIVHNLRDAKAEPDRQCLYVPCDGCGDWAAAFCPYRPCRKCGESGKHRGTVFTRSFRACTRCGGTGRELRPFAKEPEPRS
jgi:Zn-finger protein